MTFPLVWHDAFICVADKGIRGVCLCVCVSMYVCTRACGCCNTQMCPNSTVITWQGSQPNPNRRISESRYQYNLTHTHWFRVIPESTNQTHVTSTVPTPHQLECIIESRYSSNLIHTIESRYSSNLIHTHPFCIPPEFNAISNQDTHLI